MPSSTMVTRLRAVAERTMPGTLVIYRRVLSSDGAGGQSGTVTAAGTATCRAVPRRGEPREIVTGGGRIETRIDWDIYVPRGTDVLATSDYVVVQGGGTFEVLGVHGGRAYEPSRRLMCIERR